MKTFGTSTQAASFALLFLIMSLSAQAQKKGDAQPEYDKDNLPAIKFVDKRGCAMFVRRVMLDNQGEAFVVRAAHIHFGSFRDTFKEKGRLYISSSKVSFVVEEGDTSHGFDIPRSRLKEKAATVDSLNYMYMLQVNIRKGPDDINEHMRFGLVLGETCDYWLKNYEYNSFSSYYEKYYKFVQRLLNDYAGAVNEFDQITASLNRDGAQRALSPVPTSRPRNDTSAPTVQNVPTKPDQEGDVSRVSVDITSEPTGAEVYVDGVFNSSTPSKILLSPGEHTIKVTRPSYKDWERKITVERGSTKTFNAILEKIKQ